MTVNWLSDEIIFTTSCVNISVVIFQNGKLPFEFTLFQLLHATLIILIAQLVNSYLPSLKKMGSTFDNIASESTSVEIA